VFTRHANVIRKTTAKKHCSQAMFNQLHKNKTRGSEHNDLRIKVATLCNNHLIEKHTNSRSYYNGQYTNNFVRSNTLDHILLKIVQVNENYHKVTLNIV